MSQQLRSATDCLLGERFARALVAKDAEALRSILSDPIDFQALTPGRHWQASATRVVLDEIVLGRWFEPGNDIQALESVSTCQLPGRGHLSYLLRVRMGGWSEFFVAMFDFHQEYIRRRPYYTPAG